jgi:hypothetical protein
LNKNNDRLRYDFWKQLLTKSNDKTTLFAGIKKLDSYAKQNFLSTGAGMEGAKFQYVILLRKARVQLTFESKNAQKNKEIFNELNSKTNRPIIDEELGKDFAKGFIWKPLEGRKSARIEKIVINKGLLNIDDWNEIQDKMVTEMLKLEQVFGKRIKSTLSTEK